MRVDPADGADHRARLMRDGQAIMDLGSAGQA
jgi:hypothetical protein